MKFQTTLKMLIAMSLAHLLLTLAIAYVAFLAGLKANRIADTLADKANYDRKQTKALYVIADGVDQLMSIEQQRKTPLRPLQPLPIPRPSPESQK